jgi:hypothetical protein
VRHRVLRTRRHHIIGIEQQTGGIHDTGALLLEVMASNITIFPRAKGISVS